MPRERDIRAAVAAALSATNAFSDVHLTGLPEDYGFGGDEIAAATVEPAVSAAFTAGWDAQPAGALDLTAQIKVTVIQRHPDPQLRDEAAELLLNTANNAVNGQALVTGFTIPGKTLMGPWTWQPPVAPERRIVATLSVGYLVAGWDAFDTTP